MQIQGQRIIQQGLIRVANVPNTSLLVNIPQVRLEPRCQVRVGVLLDLKVSLCLLGVTGVTHLTPESGGVLGVKITHRLTFSKVRKLLRKCGNCLGIQDVRDSRL